MSDDDPFAEVREGSEFVRRERARQRALLERKWSKMLHIPYEITLRWVDGVEPRKPDPAQASVTVNGKTKTITVGEQVKNRDAYEQDWRVQRLGYRGAVEQWALWRWHIERGTPVDERDNLQLEPGFKSPQFIWEEVEAPAVAVPKRRGRPKAVSAVGA